MWNSRRVTIVLPAYNEEKYIRPAVEDFFVDGIEVTRNLPASWQAR